MWEEYRSPASLHEALETLKSYDGQAQIISGGTDIVPELKREIRQVKCLVDISGIEELKKVVPNSDNIKIGANVTHSEIASSSLILNKFPALAKAASVIGSPQIRHVATIGGNICSARPAADTIGPLIGYGAKVKMADNQGERWLPLEGLFTGPGETILRPNEILTEISMNSPYPETYSGYTKFGLRKALEIAIVSVTSVITFEQESRKCKEARIVLGAVAPKFIRCLESEKVLTGNKITKESTAKAGALAAQGCQPISDIRGSAEYRRKIVEVLVKRALEQAMQRAKQK